MRRTLSSHEKLSTAIAIVQADILARDTALIVESVFGTQRISDDHLLMAERLMAECLEDLEHTVCPAEETTS